MMYNYDMGGEARVKRLLQETGALNRSHLFLYAIPRDRALRKLVAI
jgi:hypothetical protein